MPTKDGDSKDVAQSLRQQGVQPSAFTASGVAASGWKGEETAEEPAHPTTDTLHKAAKPVGAQKEPAKITPSGSLPHDTIASGSGSIPIGAVARSEETADQLRELQNQRHEAAGRQAALNQLSEMQLSRVSKHELRAIAADRGYDIGEGGRRVLLSRFLDAQKDDKSLTKLSASEQKAADLDVSRSSVSANPETANVGGIAVGAPIEATR